VPFTLYEKLKKHQRSQTSDLSEAS
jgi:hypothetical protein